MTAQVTAARPGPGQPTVDLRIAKVANDVWGVHAVLPGATLAERPR